jgi:catechol 2,3-dioxygenase-like lactoylglutathione lyase family enzyme
MALGAIEAVRVFTTKLADARRFYADTLGLPEILATDAIAIFDTGQAKLIVEHVDPSNPEATGLVGRFTAFSFTVKNMETALNDLQGRPIEWVSPTSPTGCDFHDFRGV